MPVGELCTEVKALREQVLVPEGQTHRKSHENCTDSRNGSWTTSTTCCLWSMPTDQSSLIGSPRKFPKNRQKKLKKTFLKDTKIRLRKVWNLFENKLSNSKIRNQEFRQNLGPSNSHSWRDSWVEDCGVPKGAATHESRALGLNSQGFLQDCWLLTPPDTTNHLDSLRRKLEGRSQGILTAFEGLGRVIFCKARN